MIDMVARVVYPLSIMAGLALWARGYSEAGDGFSAGAVAGTGAALQFVSLEYSKARSQVAAAAAPAMLALGLLLALLVTLAPLAWGLPPVTHYPPPGAEVATIGALEIHSAALLDLGIALAVYGAIVGTFDRLFPTFRGDE